MGRVAFVFSGQGDQYPGMGKELAEQYPAAAAVFSMCDSIRPGTSRQCFSGTEAELKETKNTQPCLYAMEMAAAAVLIQKGILPDAAAGFSLGELSAAAAGGIFDYETGFRLVCERALLMHRESQKQESFMAAVLRLSKEETEELCKKYPQVYPVNYNCPGQITVSGLAEQKEAFLSAVKEAGGRAVPLSVSGAFHSPFMKQAAEDFAAVLSSCNLKMKKSIIPVYSNMTAMPYKEEPKKLLSGQIKSPVLWEALITQMIADGIDTFIEIGPGKTLTNMIRKISPLADAHPFSFYLKEDAQ